MSERKENLPKYSEARKDGPPEYDTGGTQNNQNQREHPKEKEEVVVLEELFAHDLKDKKEKREKEQKQKASRKNVFLELFRRKDDDGEEEFRF